MGIATDRIEMGRQQLAEAYVLWRCVNPPLEPGPRNCWLLRRRATHIITFFVGQNQQHLDSEQPRISAALSRERSLNGIQRAVNLFQFFPAEPPQMPSQELHAPLAAFTQNALTFCRSFYDDGAPVGGVELPLRESRFFQRVNDPAHGRWTNLLGPGQVL